MKTPQSIALCGLLSALALPAWAQAPLGTEFTYQGQLKAGGSPANGLHDLRFRLYDALESGTQIGDTVCADDVGVTNGLFTVPLDFGNEFSGEERFLEIDVRADAGSACTNSTGFVPLAPRQPITATPYAIQTRGIFIDDDLNVGIGSQTPDYPLHVDTDSLSRAIYGHHTATSGGTYGGRFESDSTSGRGVFGVASATSGATYGGHFESDSTSGLGVFGVASALSGVNYGLYSVSRSTSGRAVFGWASAGSGGTYGGRFESASTSGRGVLGYASADSGTNYGVYGQSASTSGRGVSGYASATTGTTYGVYGQSNSTFGRGVFGWATAAGGGTIGVQGQSASTFGRGVVGFASAGSGTNYGVEGHSNSLSGFDFYASGDGTNYGAASSRRWKSHIRNIDDPLEKIARLRGVSFDWDAEHGGHHDVGMIAEEVGKVLPEIVNYEENGIDAIGMDYSKMTPLLVEAVKALHAEVDRLQIGHEAQLRELRTERDARLAEKERRISVLEKQNEVLTARLERLEKLLTVNPQHKEMTK